MDSFLYQKHRRLHFIITEFVFNNVDYFINLYYFVLQQLKSKTFGGKLWHVSNYSIGFLHQDFGTAPIFFNTTFFFKSLQF